MTAIVSGAQGYAAEAARLVEAYESIDFADLHADVLHLLPTAPSDVLDIGAGTGRDAAALAAIGHRVVAVEPVAELRSAAQRLHAGACVEWLDDGLPDLTALSERAGAFDVIFLTAVWMHLDGAERARAMPCVARLLRSGGVLLFSLRHGPVPPGRRMFDISADETAALGAREGLSEIFRAEGRPSTLPTPGVTWTRLALRRDATE